MDELENYHGHYEVMQMVAANILTTQGFPVLSKADFI
jgi:hypothetical protein